MTVGSGQAGAEDESQPPGRRSGWRWWWWWWWFGMRTGNRQNGASYANDDVTQYYPPGQGAIDNASARIGLVLRSIVRIVRGRFVLSALCSPIPNSCIQHLLMAPRTRQHLSFAPTINKPFLVSRFVSRPTSPPKTLKI